MPELKMTTVRQQIYSKALQDVEARTIKLVSQSSLAQRIKPGSRIAITGGSRGIANIARITAAAAEAVRRLGGEPFIVPAMGSHGGGTAEGQREVLASLGISEDSCRCPVLSCMETIQLGTTPQGVAAYMDKLASQADGIIVINRVKKHTDFRAPLESGVVKMMTIGLGKRRQADLIHSYGVPGLVNHVPEVANLAVASGKIALGLAIIDNAYEETADIVALEPEAILDRERVLLRQVKRNSPRIPFDDVDVLVVDQIGKNISGTGMDTNIIARLKVAGVPDPQLPRIRTLVALSLTEESHGNAIGIGLADIVSQRLVDQMNRDATYINGVTSGFLERIKIPVTLPDDAQAIGTAVTRLSPDAQAAPKVVRMLDTLHVAELEVSEALLPEARALGLEIAGEGRPLAYERAGKFTP